MDLWNWLRPAKRHTQSARWLAPSENPWGLAVLDCSYSATTTLSTTKSPEIARRYAELRHSDGEALAAEMKHSLLTIACSLSYKIDRRPSDGPVFKSQAMEEKWDIYLYAQTLLFCRSWGGELIYRAAAEFDSSSLSVSRVEMCYPSDEKNAVRSVDFLIKTHCLAAIALHPLPAEAGRNAEKLALFSFSAFGRMGRYGTFEETVGTSYFANQSFVRLP
jgi:hypothetical protein